MSDSMFMLADACLIVVFIAVTVIFWSERANDEREKMHRMMADRLGFLVGAGAIVIVIVVQTIRHQAQPLLSGILFAMLVAKILGHVWGRRNR